MTTTQTQIPVRLDFDGHAPSFAAAMNRLDGAATKELDRVGVRRRLLRRLRAASASAAERLRLLREHAHADARAAGETDQRLALLPVWRETALFDPRERAALALTETITLVAQSHVPEADWEAAASSSPGRARARSSA